MVDFKSLEDILVATAETIRPPERLTVPEAAAKYRFVNNAGAYVGPWRNETTPYMVEPGEVLTSTDYTSMIFVGPAQCGKTDLFLNWVMHSVMCDPADMMLVEKSQTAARDFSMRRVERLGRDNPDYKAKIRPGRHNQTSSDVRYTSGAILSLSYPSINELSGKPIPRLYLTDYDRMPEDVDGEGAPYDLAVNRMKTFKRYGMTVAESSPSRAVNNARWMQKTPHEAPPTTGILALYNRGDRRRWYWKCVSCRGAFEPSFKLLKWAASADAAEAAESSYLPCPHCGQIYTHDGDPQRGIPSKRGMNIAGRWLKDGETWLEDGTIAGAGRKLDIASFWLKGAAAAFADWKGLVAKYLAASEELEKTGSEHALQTTINTDQGEPYLPRAAAASLLPEDLLARRADLGDRVVPRGVRFLVATVDVQKSSFEVKVMGVKADLDLTVVDRFSVRKSERLDEDGERYLVNPGSYPEDWNLLLDQVIRKTYPLDDASGRYMMIRATGVDSGGREGVTANAIRWWRWLRDEHNEHSRVYILKGMSNKEAPRVQVAYPDSERKDRHSGARGDVPMLQINSNVIKDMAQNNLLRAEPGGGMVSFPDWLPDTYYAEMTAEVRTSKGWENPRRVRNEAWDLLCYAIALMLSPLCRAEHIDWTAPPTWADEWDRNSLVSSEVQNRFATQPKPAYDLRKLAEEYG